MAKSFKFFSLFFLLAAFFSGGFLFAEEIDSNSVQNRRARLEAELSQLEKQIEEQSLLIQSKQRESTTLERDISIFTAQINKAKLEIKARDIAIAELNDGIKEKTGVIGDLEQKTFQEKISLSELLRRVDEMDSTSLVEIVLGYDTLSEFFEDFNSFESIQKELQVSLVEIENTQTRTEEERTSLENKKSEETELKYIQESEKKKSEQKEADKKRLLKITKGQEAEYQKILAKNQKSAAAIRTELFALRGSAAIPFEKAVEYANTAWRLTGVRPAFLLGVIAEESNLGENVGTGNWRVDMHPTRDVPVFKEITAELGLDPDQMPVSKKAWYGWGGAMGPAQFIPSTWVLYKDKVASLTGHNPPNPWDPYDAFIASAILLKENGAAAGTYSAERLAALRYLAGWKNAQKAAYAFYGDDVMELAAKYQQQIDIISR
ncbi:MAG: hypothetical protein PHC85_02645 [Candidatus Pacebacteria bacterium]|nr:hypothetical protein [Candidatus Paceibacterota bacterium]